MFHVKHCDYWFSVLGFDSGLPRSLGEGDCRHHSPALADGRRPVVAESAASVGSRPS